MTQRKVKWTSRNLQCPSFFTFLLQDSIDQMKLKSDPRKLQYSQDFCLFFCLGFEFKAEQIWLLQIFSRPEFLTFSNLIKISNL